MSVANKTGEPRANLDGHCVLITAPSVLKHLEDLHHDAFKKYHDLSTYVSEVQRDSEEVVLDYKEPRQGETPFETFLSYLSSPQGSLEEDVHEDLSHPLSNYFISSSHNTYLSGNQLSSDASASAYKDALLGGCRCVEIDVWSGRDEETSEGAPGSAEHQSLTDRFKSHMRSSSKSPKSDAQSGVATTSEILKRIEPRVLHGYTLTKEVPFREVCQTIRDNAFVTSDLPVIVSLEVHASLQQQQVMVDIITEYWNDLLLKLPTAQLGDVKSLPSPGELKRKILVKVKYTPPEKAKRQHEEEATGKPSRDRAGSVSSSDDEAAASAQAKQAKPKKKKKMLDALSDLGIYTRSYHFSGFDQPEAKIPSHVFSLSEGAVAEAHETSASELFKHNQDYFMRTYPKGSRISSSNLNPTLFWRQGVQIVALNWQSCDKGVMLNEGMFASTGGWVLKPERYRGNLSTGSHPSLPRPTSLRPGGTRTSAEASVLVDLTIEFLAAQNIPLVEKGDSESSFKPYIRCTIHTETLGSDSSSSRHSTDSADATDPKTKQTTVSGASKIKLKGQTKSQRGRSADFNSEKLSFAGVPVDDQALTFLRFKVLDDIGFRRDALAAWACFRLDRVREGLRLVHLLDAAGRLTGGFLLVKITKKVRSSDSVVGVTALPMR